MKFLRKGLRLSIKDKGRGSLVDFMQFSKEFMGECF